MAEKEKKENIIVKIYIIALFFLGIGIWYSMQSVQKEKVSIDVELDKRIVDVLVANGIKQEDILSQYVREMDTRSASWNEFHKKIQLKGEKKVDVFENGFRSVARSLKVGLSRTENADGSITYKFYSPNNRNYANVTFVSPRIPSRLKNKTRNQN